MATSTLRWACWLAFAIFLTVPPLAWHLRTIAANAQPPVDRLLAAVPVCVVVGLMALHRLRRPRWEPAVLFVIPAVVCLVKAPVGTMLALLFIASAHAIGARILREAPEEVLARLGLRFAIGAGAWMVLLFYAGLAGWLHWALIVLLLVPGLFARELAEDLGLVALQWEALAEVRHPAVTVALGFALVLGAAGALWAVQPAIAFDPVKMHLAEAGWYAAHGALRPMEGLPESFYPQGMELIQAALWTLGGQAAAQLASPAVMLGFLPLAGGLLRACGLSPGAVFCGLTAAMAMPFLHWTAFAAKNDILLALFVLGALLALCLHRPVLAAFLLAMAFGVKHVALFGAVALAPQFCIEIARKRDKLRTLLLVAGVLLLFGLHSLARSYVLTGNPVYPERAGRISELKRAGETPGAGAMLLRWLAMPWEVQFRGREAFESVSSNPMGIWLVLFAPGLWAAARRGTRAFHWTALFAALFLLYWSLNLTKVRYAIPPLLLLTAGTAAVLFELPRRIAAAVSAYALFFSLTVVAMLTVSVPQLAWFAGRMGDDAYLTEMLPTYAAARALEGIAGVGEAVLVLDGCASTYMPSPGSSYCLSQHDLGQSGRTGEGEALSGRYRYAIVPRGVLADRIAAGAGVEIVSADERSILFRLPGSGTENSPQ